MMSLHELHTPVDIDAQSEEWGANCGPAVLAAALGMRVADVRPLVEPFRGYMGIPQMKAALFRRREAWLNAHFTPHVWTQGEHALLSSELRRVIEHDVAAMPLLIAWDGPWRAVHRAVAAHRHWIAVATALSDVYVYDVNASWQTLRDWWENTARDLVPKRGTGGFTLQWGARLRVTERDGEIPCEDTTRQP